MELMKVITPCLSAMLAWVPILRINLTGSSRLLRHLSRLLRHLVPLVLSLPEGPVLKTPVMLSTCPMET
eukprot:4619143-Amphidinium_carterae.1